MSENIFDDNNVVPNNWVKFSKVEDKITGTLISVKSMKSRLPGQEGKDVAIYELKADGGEYHDIDDAKKVDTLYKKHRFRMYWGNYFIFLYKYLIHLSMATGIFLMGHLIIFKLLAKTRLYSFFYLGWGYWIFTIPLFLFTMGFLYLIRKNRLNTKILGKTKIYFLDI